MKRHTLLLAPNVYSSSIRVVSTLAAIARRAVGFPVIGGDIVEYRETKLRTVAEAGIFDQAAADAVVADATAAWGLADEPILKKFVSA